MGFQARNQISTMIRRSERQRKRSQFATFSCIPQWVVLTRMCMQFVVNRRGGRVSTEVREYRIFFLLWRCDPTRVMASSFLRFLDHTQRRTTVGRSPLNEWSARRRDLYLTTHNTHNRQTSMPPVGFEPTISAGERPQTYALDRAATGTGSIGSIGSYNDL